MFFKVVYGFLVSICGKCEGNWGGIFIASSTWLPAADKRNIFYNFHKENSVMVFKFM